MTPKITPQAPASAAVASRARPASDASDPFALHLENATEQAASARGKDKPDDDSSKVDASTKPATARPRKGAVKRKTTDRSDTTTAKPDADGADKADDADAAHEADHAQASDDTDDTDDAAAKAKAEAEAEAAPQPANPVISAEAIENAALAAQPIPAKENPKPKLEGQDEKAAEPKISLVENPPKQLPQPALPQNPAADDPDEAAPKVLAEKHPRPKPALEQEPQLSNQKDAEKQAAQKPAADASQDDADKPDVTALAPRGPRSARASADHLAEKSATDKTAAGDPGSVAPGQTASSTSVTASTDFAAALFQKSDADASEDGAAGSPRAAAPLLSLTQSPANSPAAHSAEVTRAAQDSPQTSQENTFDQIVLGLRTKMDAANQKAQIELNPPNLGKLQVSVEVSNGMLTAQFHTGSDVVRDLLSSRMDHLRSVLEGQGISVDKLAVSSAPSPGDAGSSAGNQTSQNHDGRSGGAFSQERQASRQSSGDAFARMWRTAREKEEPIDLLA